MKNLKFLLALAFFLITFTTSVTAQPYPITTTTQLSTPQLPQLESLADPTNNTVFLSLVLNDITQPTYNLRLRLIISGNGINIETDAQAFVPSPINLQYNVPVLLNGGDLSAYFKLDNLRFSGMTKAEYLRLGTLPEGLYSVCFEAYDYNRFLEPPVSNRSCATSNLEVHDPPVILNPIGEYPFTTPQQLQFNWQNRHIGAFPVEYELRIYEKRPGLTDDQILVSMPPLFRVTTRLPTYSYGPTDPLLREAQAYLTVVQIRDLTDNNYFKNLGNSKPETFILKTPCRPGLACSDNDDCTLNDTYDKECNCIGTPFYDPNGDGLADPVTIPAPTIVKPDKEICVNDGKSVIAWTPNHDLNIEVQYELSIWLDKVDVTQTPEYLEYQQYLQASLEKFLASQKYEYEIFIKEQQTQKEEWTKGLEATEAKCQEEIRQIYDKFAQGQQTSLEEFRAYLKDFSDKCEADKQAAIEAFRKELKKEIIEFEENQKANKAEIATTLKNQEAEFLANQQQAATDFEAKQTTDLKNFLAQQEKSAAENQAQFEQDMAAIQDAKVAAEVEYQTCLEEADNFRNTARLDYLEAIAPIQQEIGLVNLVLQNLKTNFVNTRLELRNQYRADLRNARTRADRRRIQVAYRAAVRAGRDEFRADFAEEKAEKEPLRAQIAELRAALKAALSNAKATIEEMKTVCEQEYAAELKDLADKETSLINALANSEVQAVSDYEAFLEAQAAEAAEFVKNQENEAAEFQEQLAETVAAFAEEQAAAYAEFKQKLAEREKVFYEKLSDCKALIAEEAAFFEARQKEEKAAFGAKIKEKAAYCSIYTKEQLNKLAEVQKKQQAEFLAQQAEQLAAVKDKLAAQFAAYVKELEAQYSKGLPKLVYTNKLDSLYQHLLPTDYPLMPGYTYTTQVQATVPCSRVTIENDGLSEMQTFVISGDAPIVEPTPPTKAPTTSTYPSRGMLGSASSGISVYHPYIAPPQSLIATVLTTSSFQANWSPMKSAEYYILEVATDDNFNNLLPAYSGIVLSNTATSYMIENIEGEDFYYRVRSGNSCSLTEFSGIITVSVSTAPACIVGADCDDGLPCTINDKIGKDCKCYGRHTGDEDGDTVCDAMDICPGHNDLEDTDGDGVPDACDECNGECDDGDDFTVNDTWVQNPEVPLNQPPPAGVELCLCVGTPLNELDCRRDSDNDGICDENDICPGHNDLADSDGDGIPNGCDICPEGNNDIDDDQDGIPDACDELVEDCNAFLLMTIDRETLCDYRVVRLAEGLDCQTFINSLFVRLPGSELPTKFNINSNAAGFQFPYCNFDGTSNDCGAGVNIGVNQFVQDLQNWLDDNDFKGTVTTTSFVVALPGLPTVEAEGISITQSDVRFLDLSVVGCWNNATIKTRVFEKSNCNVASTAEYSVEVIGGNCESPAYLWNNGATTNTISIEEDHEEYSVTVTCLGGCIYTLENDTLCIVGASCTDFDECTENDVIQPNCLCAGEYVGDSDGDTVCDALDECPGEDDYTPDCNNNCEDGTPCDDGLSCTINDVYDKDCNCIGLLIGDSDGDLVCDPLDKCEGYPDYDDMDDDGIPDGCDDDFCNDENGEPLPYYDIIKSLYTCMNSIDSERVYDMRVVSQLYAWQVNPNFVVTADGIVETDNIGDGGDDFNVEDLPNPFEEGIGSTTGFDPTLLVDDGANLVDTDPQGGDGVADLFDLCPCGDDSDDANQNGFPDACESADGLTYQPCPEYQGTIRFGLILSLMFDRTCTASFPSPSAGFNGDIDAFYCDADIEGLYNCNCECEIDEAAFDVDGDNVCNTSDDCHGADDQIDNNGNGIIDGCEPLVACEDKVVPCDPAAFNLENPSGCYSATYWVFDNAEGKCICKGILDGDDDADGVCNADDKCPGTYTLDPVFEDDENGNPVPVLDEEGIQKMVRVNNSGNDNDNSDGDDIPDDCDLCDNNEFPGNIGEACDDQNPCTIIDKLDYVYGEYPIEDKIPADIIAQLDFTDPLVVSQAVTLTNNNKLVGFYYKTEPDGTQTQWVTIVDACDCIGQLIDSDGDGVCDNDDICPGFDDFYDPDGDGLSNNNFQDYDNDGIPDGCDPPYYDEIPCPGSGGAPAMTAKFLQLPFAGLVLTIKPPFSEGLSFSDFPSPISIDVIYVGNSDDLSNIDFELTSVDGLVLTTVQNLGDEVQVFYEITDPSFVLPEEYISLTLQYSEHQSCNIVPAPTDVNPFGDDNGVLGCPEDIAIDESGNLKFYIPYPSGAIDFSSLPNQVGLDISLNGESNIEVVGIVTDIAEEYLNGSGSFLVVITDIPFDDAITSFVGSVFFDPIVNGDGIITDAAKTCTFDGNGIILNPCGHYTGEPCNDGDSYTSNDEYDEECYCAGVVGHDADNDGVHDELDICPGSDDFYDPDGDGLSNNNYQDNNGNGIPDGCDCPTPIIESLEVVNSNDLRIVLQAQDTEAPDFDANLEYVNYTVTWTPDIEPSPVPAPLQPQTQPMETNLREIEITNGELGITYTVSVVATCASSADAKSPPAEAILEIPISEDDFACGIPVPADCANMNPLVALMEDDIITVGDFQIIIDNVTSGGNGTFSGSGHFEVPMLNFAVVNTTFSNVFITEEYKMCGPNSEMGVTGIGAEILSEELTDLISDFNNNLENINDVLGEIQGALEQLEAIVAQMNDLTDANASLVNGIASILTQLEYLPNEVSVTFQTEIDACQQLLDDGNLEEWKTCIQAAIAKVKEALLELYNADYHIVFERFEGQTYGFDKKEHEAHTDNYWVQKIAGEDYVIAWKSVRSGNTPEDNDKVVALKGGGGNIPQSVRFDKDGPTNPIDNGEGDPDVILTVSGEGDENLTEIYAIQTKNEADEDVTHIAGRLNVISYEEDELNIVVVPVNGADYPFDIATLETKLATIFAQAVVKVNVTAGPALQVSDFDNTINDVPNSLLSAYTYEMKDIIREYKNTHGFEDDTYYVYIVNDAEQAGLLGFMPKKRDHGFLFKSKIMAEPNPELMFQKVMAHELGHGAFHLEHTFEEYTDLGEGTTDNLMDYGNNQGGSDPGTHLHKYQWDLIHNPAPVNTLLDDDEEGEYVTVNILEIIKDEWITNGFVSFINPKGEIVSFQQSLISSVTFATGGEVVESQNITIPVGTLTHIVLREAPQSNIISDYHFDFSNDNYKDPAGSPYLFIPPPPNTTPIPIIARHCRKDFQHAIHVVSYPYYEEPGDDINLLSFDFLLPAFFEMANGGSAWSVVQPENVFQNSEMNKFMNFDEIIGGDLYKFFIETYEYHCLTDIPDYANYQEISSFYLSGLAMFVDKYANYATICTNENAEEGKRNFLGDIATFLMEGIPGAMSEEVWQPGLFTSYENSEETQLLENTLGRLINSSFFNESNLTAADVINNTVGIIKGPETVYQNLLPNIENNPENLDKFLDYLMGKGGPRIRACEFNLLPIDTYEQAIALFRRMLERQANSAGLGDVNWFPDGIISTSNPCVNAIDHYWLDNEEEWIMIKLLSRIELHPTRYAEFITFLESEIPGTSPKKRYWAKLIEGVEDSWFDSNGTALMQKILNIYNSLAQSSGNDISARVNALDNAILEVWNNPDDAETINYDKLMQLQLPVVPYNYTNILKRVDYWEALGCGFTNGGLIDPFDLCDWPAVFPPTDITEVIINEETNRIKIWQVQKHVVVYNLYDDSNPIGSYYNPGFKPFDPIIIDKKSSFSTAAGLLNSDDFVVFPAIALFYLEEMADGKTGSDIVITGLDLATMAFAVGALPKIGRLIAGLDIASSSASLAATYGQDDWPPEVVNTLHLFSLSTGIASIVTSVNRANKLKNIANNAQGTNRSQLLQIMQKDPDVQEYVRYNELLDYLKNDQLVPDNVVATWLPEFKEKLALLIANRRYKYGSGLVNDADVIYVLSKLHGTAYANLQSELVIALMAINIPPGASSLPGRLAIIDNIDDATDLVNFLKIPDNSEILRSFHKATTNGNPDMVQLAKQWKQNNPLTYTEIFSGQETLLTVTQKWKFFEDLGESSTLRGWFLSGEVQKIQAWEVLNNLPIEIRSDIKVLARLLDDFEAHPEFKAFLEADEGRPLKWAVWNRNGFTPTNYSIAEWVEDIWNSGNVQIIQGNNKVDVIYSGSKVAEIGTDGSIIKFQNGISEASYTADDVVAASMEGAIVCKNGNCGWGSASCFIGGTLVKKGLSEYVAIENMEQGDTLLCQDIAANKVIKSTVTETFTRAVGSLIKITTENDTLWTTKEHPFYSKNHWLPAIELKQGSELLTNEQKTLIIQDIQIIDTVSTVYNFEVEGCHNYFVGQSGILVHNADYSYSYYDETNPAHVALATEDGFLKQKGMIEADAILQADAEGLISNPVRPENAGLSYTPPNIDFYCNGEWVDIKTPVQTNFSSVEEQFNGTIKTALSGLHYSNDEITIIINLKRFTSSEKIEFLNLVDGVNIPNHITAHFIN